MSANTNNILFINEMFRLPVVLNGARSGCALFWCIVFSEILNRRLMLHCVTRVRIPSCPA